jgi:hypothetical protein
MTTSRSGILRRTGEKRLPGSEHAAATSDDAGGNDAASNEGPGEEASAARTAGPANETPTRSGRWLGGKLLALFQAVSEIGDASVTSNGRVALAGQATRRNVRARIARRRRRGAGTLRPASDVGVGVGAPAATTTAAHRRPQQQSVAAATTAHAAATAAGSESDSGGQQ